MLSTIPAAVRITVSTPSTVAVTGDASRNRPAVTDPGSPASVVVTRPTLRQRRSGNVTAAYARTAGALAASAGRVRLDTVRTTVAGVLLAAGEGSRFGQPKALVEFSGQTLAERGVHLLRAGGADPILVVTGAVPLELERDADR